MPASQEIKHRYCYVYSPLFDLTDVLAHAFINSLPSSRLKLEYCRNSCGTWIPLHQILRFENILKASADCSLPLIKLMLLGQAICYQIR